MVRTHALLWQWDANAVKSHVINFHPQGPGPGVDSLSWTWGNTTLPRQPRTKLLGMILTEDCRWDEHTKYATQKGNNAYHAWKRVLRQPYLDRSLKLRIINTLIYRA